MTRSIRGLNPASSQVEPVHDAGPVTGSAPAAERPWLSRAGAKLNGLAQRLSIPRQLEVASSTLARLNKSLNGPKSNASANLMQLGPKTEFRQPSPPPLPSRTRHAQGAPQAPASIPSGLRPPLPNRPSFAHGSPQARAFTPPGPPSALRGKSTTGPKAVQANVAMRSTARPVMPSALFGGQAVKTPAESANLEMEQRSTNRLLEALQNSARGGSTHADVTPWQDLDDDIKQVYDYNQWEYETQVTQLVSGKGISPVPDILKNNGMHAIPNNGTTGNLSNNCFLISLMQHATGNYSTVDERRINQYRDILIDASLANPNEKIASRSEAVKTMVTLINQDPDVNPKLDVHIVSSVGGKPFIERLGEQTQSARKVVIWDQGGHFEAVTPNYVN